MAFGKKKASTTLVATLATKQSQLLDQSDEKNDTAAYYLTQANSLTAEAATHAAHARALGEARDVLDKAGVSV